LKVVVKSCIGCNIARWFINILAYADDMVLLAPSWKGLQCLLDIIDKAAVDIDMSFNTKKTVCMIFNPLVKYKMISDSFPQFHLAVCNLSFVPNFK